jgi:prephenate dehydrogenase
VANKDAVATLVESYADEMTQLAKAIRDDDIDTLTKMFTNAKKHRDAFIDGI